jgi:peptidoglycan/xylan/chitin deacetylase (PgdA/CDA1 family)
MYHRISRTDSSTFLTVRESDLEAQFQYLQQHGYHAILLSDLVNYVHHNIPLPANPVLITFDDGYRDNFFIMYPLLQQYSMKASIFLVPALLYHEVLNPHDAQDVYLHVCDIRAMDPTLVEYGLHSFDHKNLKTTPLKEVDADISLSKALLQSMGISFQPCLAFPYGGYPKRGARSKQFFQVLRDNKIMLAFRIGNRLNPLPVRNHLLIQRLDVEKNCSIEKFDRMMRKGKSIF